MQKKKFRLVKPIFFEFFEKNVKITLFFNFDEKFVKSITNNWRKLNLRLPIVNFGKSFLKTCFLIFFELMLFL